MLLAMASGGTPHDSNPFGYSFHHPVDSYNNEQDISVVAAQPVGPPLLDNAEANFLNHFLSNPDAAFDPTNAFLHPDLQPKNDPSQEYNWLYQEPPPTLHSVTASISTQSPVRQSRHSVPQSLLQQQQQQHSYIDRSNSVPDIHGRDDDVYGAASALFGSATQPSIHTHFLNESLYPGQGAVMSSLRIRDPVSSAISTTYYNPSIPAPTHAPHQTHNHSNGLPLGLFAADTEDNPYALFDSTAFAAPTDNGNPRLYRFGSDSHFASNGFLPSGPSEDTLTSSVLSKMFEPIVSAANSRPDSPTETRHNITGSVSAQRKPIDRQDAGGSDDSEVDRAGPGPSKRRKSKHTRDNSDHHISAAGVQRVQYMSERGSGSTASQAPRRPTSSSAKSPTKRRKPSPNESQDQSASARKPARENLSEEQKRSNHIQSEQKRRNLIKQGFQDLEILVPELRSGGFSKSNMLVEAAKFLEQLLQTNEALKQVVGEQ